MNPNLGFTFTSKLKDMLKMLFVRCLHFLNAIELWLNVRLNKKKEQERSLLNMTQPLSHDQLCKIAEGISVSLPDVLENVFSGAKTRSYEKGPVNRKLFVGSLGCHTTSENLLQFFSVYGEIEDAHVAREKSGVSKQYGFVTFKNVKSALMALKEPYKKINGKMTVTEVSTSRAREDDSLRKVYVANVPHDMFPGKLLDYFSLYGEIEKGPFGFDLKTGKFRGYALFVYKTLEGAKTAISEPNKFVDGHHLICEMAIRGTKKKAPVSPNSTSFNINCNNGPGSILGRGGSRPEYHQCNKHMYPQNCDCGLVSNGGNIHGGLSPTFIGCNHVNSGFCSKLGHADYRLWSSDFPSHKPFRF